MSRSAQISIFGGGGGILKLKSQSAKICPNFNFRGGGGILKLKSQSAKISDNFHFRGGGGGILKLYFRIGVFCRIWTKISTTPAGSCITVVSHILRLWRLMRTHAFLPHSPKPRCVPFFCNRINYTVHGGITTKSMSSDKCLFIYWKPVLHNHNSTAAFLINEILLCVDKKL